MQLEGQRPAGRAEHRRDGQPAQLQPGQHDHADEDGQQDQGDAERRLLDDEPDQRRGAHDGQRDLARPRPLAGVAQPAEHQRADQHEGQLGELGRLDLEPAGQVDPGVRAVDHAAQRAEHGDQAEQRDTVDHRGPGPDPADVERGHRHHQDQPDSEPERLLVQVRARVSAGGDQPRLGGRPDEQGAEDAQRQYRRDQQPVQMTEERLLSERTRGQRGSRAGPAAPQGPVPPGSRCERVALSHAAEAHWPLPLRWGFIV